MQIKTYQEHFLCCKDFSCEFGLGGTLEISNFFGRVRTKLKVKSAKIRKILGKLFSLKAVSGASIIKTLCRQEGEMGPVRFLRFIFGLIFIALYLIMLISSFRLYALVQDVECTPVANNTDVIDDTNVENSSETNVTSDSSDASGTTDLSESGIEVLSVQDVTPIAKEETSLCRNSAAERVYFVSTILFALLIGTLHVSQIENINNEILQKPNVPKYTWHWVFCIEVVVTFLQILSVFEIVPWEEIENETLPQKLNDSIVLNFNIFYYAAWIFGSLLVVSCFGSIDTFGEPLSDTGRLTHYFKSCLICLVFMVICVEGVVCMPGQPKGCKHIEVRLFLIMWIGISALVLAYSLTEICIFAFSGFVADSRLQAENAANEQRRTTVNYDARNGNLSMPPSLPQNPLIDSDATTMYSQSRSNMGYIMDAFEVQPHSRPGIGAEGMDLNGRSENSEKIFTAMDDPVLTGYIRSTNPFN